MLPNGRARANTGSDTPIRNVGTSSTPNTTPYSPTGEALRGGADAYRKS